MKTTKLKSRTGGIQGVFVTGTDTGVGKTYIAAGIARALRNKGIDVGVMKPAETGCRNRAGKLVPADAVRLKAAAGADDDLDMINPYRFKKPLAPAIAAELEGKTIDPRELLTIFRKLVGKHEYVIVEGAGGIMVPIRGKYTYLDLAAALLLPVLVVARPGLGTINHSLLTIAALRARGVAVAGMVLNYALAFRTGIAERTNKAALERISEIPVLGTFHHGAGDFNELADLLKE